MKKDLKRQPKRIHPKEKAGLHPRNRHRERYDFSELVRAVPELEPFVRLNDYQDASIVFSDKMFLVVVPGAETVIDVSKNFSFSSGVAWRYGHASLRVRVIFKLTRI